MDSPLRGSWLDHRSPADAFGLTRFACQTAIEKDIQETTAKTLKPSTNSPAPTGQDSCRRAAKIVDAGQCLAPGHTGCVGAGSNMLSFGRFQNAEGIAAAMG